MTSKAGTSYSILDNWAKNLKNTLSPDRRMLSRAEEIACRGSRSDFHFWRTDASPLEKAPNRKGREGLGKGAKTTIAVADDITTSENTEDHWRLGRAGHSPRVRTSAWAGEFLLRRWSRQPVVREGRQKTSEIAADAFADPDKPHSSTWLASTLLPTALTLTMHRLPCRRRPRLWPSVRVLGCCRRCAAP